MFLYFVRHGESEANISRTFSNRDLAHHLTDVGREQARQLASILEERGVDELWSSPVPRAVETAAIVASVLRVPYQTTDALREFDVGRFEGTASPEGWKEYMDVVQAWMRGDYERRVGGGESLTETVTRLNRFLQQFMNAKGEERTIAFIAHGGLYCSALPHVLSNVSREFAFQNTRGYNLLITATLRDSHFVCTDWDGKLPARESKMASDDQKKPN